ncbi:MAG: MFS transporter [Pseudomonadota bacterium]
MSKQHTNIRNYLSALIGTALEYYDYSLFIFLAPVLAKLFFPQDDTAISLIKTYGLGFVGTLARPLGAYIFGVIGDRCGRRYGLFYAITTMTIASICMAVLPTYHDVGIFAPTLLVLCRFLQSISAGGELNGSAVFIIEHVQENQKSTASGLICGFTVVGILLASFISYLCINSSNPELYWRYAFMLGTVIGLVGFFMRYFTQETPAFLMRQISHDQENSPQMPVLARFFCAFAISGTFSSYYYFSFVLMNSYLPLIRDIPQAIASGYTTKLLVVYMFALIIGGAIADKLPQRKIMIVGASSVAISAIPYMYLISYGGIESILMARVGLILLIALFMGPTHAALIKIFPVRMRYRSTSVCYSLGSALMGSITPVLSIYLWHKTGIPWLPGLWLMATSMMGMLAVFYAFEAYGKQEVLGASQKVW